MLFGFGDDSPNRTPFTPRKPLNHVAGARALAKRSTRVTTHREDRSNKTQMAYPDFQQSDDFPVYHQVLTVLWPVIL